MPIVRSCRRLSASLVIPRFTTAALLMAGIGWYALQPSRAAGTVSLTGGAYAQNFDTLAPSGTGNTTVPSGWEFSETGSNANTTYTAGTGSGNAGDTYSFGASGSSERAFGGLLSGSLVPLLGAQFTNNTGGTITSLSISYTGEQWRLGASGRGADRIDFQLSTDASGLTTGTWTDYDALDFSSPVSSGAVGALDGNLAPNRSNLSLQITGLTIAPNAAFWIRWVDFNASGADDGLAVDDFSLTPAAGLTINDVTLTEGNAGTTTYSFTVSLSTPAPAGGVTFDIATADDTAVAPGDYASTSLTGQTIPAGSSSYTFNVPVNGDILFESNETFFVNVTNVVGADVADAQGVGTIANDDPACGQPATAISAVQGSGLTSPLVGTTVTIEGIVTGDYQAPGQLGGYYVQEEDDQQDGDSSTSDGIFVFNTSRAVDAGDRVRVTGTVTEFTTSGVTLTELIDVTSRETCATGQQVTATSVTLPVASLGEWERLEGMLVTFTQPLVATGVFTLSRFGEVELALESRLAIPTHAAAPGADALAVRAINDRSRILLDDGNGRQNIDPTIHPVGGLSAANTLRVGNTVTGLTGVLEQRFGVYRVQPIGPVPFAATNPRTASPADVGGSLKVASFNVLNYFNGDGLGGGFPTARGADTSVEFQRQRAKTVNAILGIASDIVGLMELENDPTGNSAIEDLVDGLNASAGTGTYAFIDTGVVGTDQIRVGLIYKPATVAPVGAHAVIDSTVDPAFIDTLNRPSLAQTFVQLSTGARLTVVVNHLKSKGSDCNAAQDPDTGDLQGNCNLTRTKAAQALVRWLATDPTGSQESDVLLIGDMNSYRLEDPITALRAGGYVDLQTAQSYSYVFDGESGYLDHVLASPSLVAQVTGVTEWHINADEPPALDYNVEFKSPGQITSFYSPEPYRASDHDPVVVGLDLKAPFDFGGFGRPIAGGAVTEAKAGSGVPITFSLGGDLGLDIFAAGSPVSAPLACGTDPSLFTGDTVTSAGGSGLSYDPDAGQYTFVWKTEKAWAGTCRRLTVTFTDGTWHRADVYFRR